MLPNVDNANNSVPRVCVSTGAASVFSTHFRNHTSVFMPVGELIGEPIHQMLHDLIVLCHAKYWTFAISKGSFIDYT